jgi:hypothetical protein
MVSLAPNGSPFGAGEAGAQVAWDHLIVRNNGIGARGRCEHEQDSRGETGRTPKVSHATVVGPLLSAP